MLRRALRPRNLLLIGGTLASGAYLIESTDNALSHTGAVRFARVGIVVCFFLALLLPSSFLLKASKMIIDYKLTMLSRPKLIESAAGDAESLAYRERLSACHQRGAERVLSLCRRNGGVFIKVGQHIASLQVGEHLALQKSPTP